MSKLNLTPCQYHGINDGIERGDPSWFMSRSDLCDILVCPEFWMRGGSPPSSDAIKIGSLVDAMTTDPGQVERGFTVLDADRYPARYRDAEKETGKYIVKKKDLAKCHQMVDSLRSKTIVDWDGMSVGEMLSPDYCAFQVVYSVGWESDGITVPVRVMLDVEPLSEDVNWIGDIKTTRVPDPKGWARQFKFEHGLKMQAALYLDVYNAHHAMMPLNDAGEHAWEGLAQHFLHFIVGNTAPHLAAVRMPSVELIEQGRRLYQRALRRYTECLQSGRWPGFGEGIELVEA